MAWTGHGKNFFNPVKTGCVHLITGGVVDRFHSRTRSVVRPALAGARYGAGSWLHRGWRRRRGDARARSAPSRTSQSAYRALKQCASDQALCLSLYSLSTSGGSAGLRRQHRGALSDQLCQTIRRSLGTEALGRPGTLHHGAELMRVQLVDLAPRERAEDWKGFFVVTPDTHSSLDSARALRPGRRLP